MAKPDIDNLRGVIFCCHGGSCTRAGARTVDKALRLHAREIKLKSQIRLVRTACTGLCKSAPVVIICVNPLSESTSSESGVATSTCGAMWRLEVQPEQAAAPIDAHFGRPNLPKPSAEPDVARSKSSKDKKRKDKKRKAKKKRKAPL